MFARRTNWDLAPNALTEALERVRAGGREVLDLTVSNPTACGFQYEEQRIRAALANEKALVYEPAPFGILSARAAVAGYYAGHGVRVSPEQVLLGVSTSELYSYLFRLLCDPGDEVLVPRPGYPLFDLLADVEDVKLAPYELFYDHGWHLDAHSVEQAISQRTRAVMVVSPNNPTGSYLAGNEAAALEAICARRGLAIVADEVFLDYPLEAAADGSWAARDRALTFTLSGLSKIAALPQIKLAWCVVGGPEQAKREALKRLEIIADTYLSVNAPVQHALPELLATSSAIQKQIAQRCRENLRALDEALRAHAACSRLRADAGWSAILRIPRQGSDEAFVVRLLESAGVLVHPGHFYNFIQEGYVVVSLLVEAEAFAAGIARLLAAAERRSG